MKKPRGKLVEDLSSLDRTAALNIWGAELQVEDLQLDEGWTEIHHWSMPTKNSKNSYCGVFAVEKGVRPFIK